VSVSASPVRAKVSLGTNPWNQATADKNLASLAEQYGGGGHPRVSAISFDPQDLERAGKWRGIWRRCCGRSERSGEGAARWLQRDALGGACRQGLSERVK